MRLFLIPALALLMGSAAFAQDHHQDWKYRAHRSQRPNAQWQHEADSRRNWERPSYEHRYDRRPWHPERERVVILPAPPTVHVHPLPLPPPPPVSFHFWFGF